MKRIIEVILCVFIVIFLSGIIVMGIQVIGEDSPNQATIFSGVLSMVGGLAGALGAYFVASNQMNKQFEHEKTKETKRKIETILQNLKKLELLNNETIAFIDFFKSEYSVALNEEKAVMLKFSEQDLHWIVNNINNMNDEVLTDGYALDYLRISRELNNMYIDLAGLNYIPDEHRSGSLQNLIESMLNRRESFVSFDKYVKEHIEELQKEHETLN